MTMQCLVPDSPISYVERMHRSHTRVSSRVDLGFLPIPTLTPRLHTGSTSSVIVSIAIIVISIWLAIFWLRYTCVLLMQQSRDTADGLIRREGLHFRDVSKRLQGGEISQAMHENLNRDYAALTRLLEKAKADTIEAQILKADYILMSAWWRITRWIAPKYAAHCLREMTQVLDTLAHTVAR